MEILTLMLIILGIAKAILDIIDKLLGFRDKK